MIVFDQFSCKICFNGYGERRLFWGVMTVTVWGPGRPLSVPFLICTSGKGTNKAKPARLDPGRVVNAFRNLIGEVS